MILTKFEATLLTEDPIAMNLALSNHILNVLLVQCIRELDSAPFTTVKTNIENFPIMNKWLKVMWSKYTDKAKKKLENAMKDLFWLLIDSSSKVNKIKRMVDRLFEEEKRKYLSMPNFISCNIK